MGKKKVKICNSCLIIKKYLHLIVCMFLLKEVVFCYRNVNDVEEIHSHAKSFF